MPSTLIDIDRSKFRKKKGLGKDKADNGQFLDKRKSRLFFIKEEDLDSKTELEGLRKTVFADRYSLKSVEDGKPMEMYPEQMWARVAKGIAQFEPTAEKRKIWEKKFYEVMQGFKFVPAGRILSGAGTGYEVTFFNCYVIPCPHDSRGGIMESVTQTVEIQARAGGVGLNLSTLRPRGERVRKVNGTSSGAVNWASLYSTANHDVIQQGGSRRGALMLMLHDWHPDVKEFIRVKEDLTKIPGANLSVCVSDKFMKAVKEDKEWELVFPDINDSEYDEKWTGDIDEWRSLGKGVKVYDKVSAGLIWDMIGKAAWRSAEPGLHFLERSNKRSNTWYFEKLIATNPCGEQPLGAWSVCNLGALNLVAYVNEETGEFDYKSLSKDAKIAMRFMDNVVDANFYFYAENQEAQRDIRRTGLGTMGLGDALLKMKIRYGSEESINIINKIYKTVRDSAYEASSDLAKEKGSFPKFDKNKFLEGHFIKRLSKDLRAKIAKQGIRNGVVLTQAPTGTTSLLSGVSSGIEPNYDFEFTRTDRTGEHTIYHPLYAEWKTKHPGEVPPSYFVTSKDLTPEDHVRVQAKIQEYTDSSISKTVNAPEGYSVEDVKKLYMLAYDLGCKGITFFRDGSRKGVLERASDKKEEKKQTQTGELKPRPIRVEGATYKITTPLGNAFITVNHDEIGNPFEVFVTIGKAGSEVAAMAEALGRLISTTLRFGNHSSPLERAKSIMSQLQGIGGANSVGFGPDKVRSLPDAIAKALGMHFGLIGFQREEKAKNGEAKKSGQLLIGQMFLADKTKDICPSCGNAGLVSEEGCKKCYSCGFSQC